MPENRSPHILSTSANLLGICFIVLTSLKKLNLVDDSLIDEFAVAAVMCFMTSCILSFISMRRERNKSQKLEKIADFVFLSGLIILFVATILIAFNLIS
ncbi:MAG: hypothetical protein ABWZ79_06110 [Pedobacter agri]|uniref:hypothetical protein n=1 Tax=Pedobacter TaxID=84567 RepID=UPI00029A36D0|nr:MULTISPECIES: hypothetical protein [Pedobacter]AZI26067.1 hypothetical protein EA772_12205 [Pedobacter sp. G11]MDQ1142126.1 putative membrane channel-forming protein YqfA (hemolysin III family) [Pedobacter agri]RZJ77314.1 MAG: hypothetical protein EOO47_17170 [Flavobacterium sp.]